MSKEFTTDVIKKELDNKVDKEDFEILKEQLVSVLVGSQSNSLDLVDELEDSDEDNTNEASYLLSGDSFPTAAIGEDGDFYINIKDWVIYGPKRSEWPLGTPLKGRDGLDGRPGIDGRDGKDGAPGKDGEKGKSGGGSTGTQLYAGDTTPNEGIGSLGDFYIDKVAKLFYGPKTAVWGTGVSLGGGGGGTWGSITGTLSDQTDLITALNLKANTADLAAVAFSGDYSDLSGTLPETDPYSIHINGDNSCTYAGTVTRDGNGRITAFARTGGLTYTPTRDGNNKISSITDGTLVWAFTRTSGRITSWTVT